MKTIKIIDLINKINNNEELPKKIKYNGFEWEYNLIENNYIRAYEIVAYRLTLGLNELNDEVEIIEEKKIPEKLGKIEDNDGYIDQYDVIKIGKKVDEIIDYLKSKGE